jgi:hypothetical protein
LLDIILAGEPTNVKFSSTTGFMTVDPAPIVVPLQILILSIIVAFAPKKQFLPRELLPQIVDDGAV